MADLRIVDAPLLSTVKGTEKIPTGGEGNFSVSVDQVADFAKLKWVLATEEYVDNAVGNVQADLNLHKNNSSNPHGVTKAQVGLGNVNNTADLDKPLSNANIAALSLKADKIYVDSQDQLKADKSQVAADLSLKADKTTTYTKSETDSLVVPKADKTYVDAAVGAVSTDASKQYATLALAEADISNIALNKNVFISEAVNGGYWYKATAGATSLTKSPYDPLEQAKADATTKANAAKAEAIATATTDATTKANAAEANAKNYTDSSIDNVEADVAGKISTKPTNADLLQLKDVNGDDYLRIDNNGHIYLADRGWESLQTELQRLPEHSIKVEDLINIFDASGNLILRQDVDGYLYLPNMKDSVQVAITNRDQNADVFVNSDLVYERLHFTDALNPYLMKMVASTIYAPIPYGLLPSNYQIDDSIISGFTANVSSTHIPLTTVYRADDDIVHPHIIETIDGIRGYKYIMGITGYLNVREENPMIFGSNDLINFELLTGFVQPLGLPESTGYLSDIGFIYDPTTGDFICFWRCTVELGGGATETSLRYKRTKDLTTWGSEVQFYPFTKSATDNLISPAILFNPNDRYWYMWTVFGSSGEIRLRKARTLEGLATVPYTRILNTGAAMPWHIEVKWVGNKFVMIPFNNTTNNLFLGVSSDGESWVFNQTPLFTSNPLEFYKASFAASFDGNGDLYLDVLYNQGKKLYHSTTNSININGALV